MDDIKLLRLLQLADSALPIGATAHSFGLETLTAEDELTVERLEHFLHAHLEETSALECTCCRLAFRIPIAINSSTTRLRDEREGIDRGEVDRVVSDEFAREWLALNARLSAWKVARESRVASATLGRRFLQLAGGLLEHPVLDRVLHVARQERIDIHYATAFGLVGRVLEIDESVIVLAYLQQSLTGLVSACQRLLPLGQSLAGAMLWRLKSVQVEVAARSKELAQHPDEIAMCAPLLDLASMRHPSLMTRLFIS